MNKKHAYILIFTSAVLNALVFFLEEKNYSLSFLTNKNEFGNWMLFVAVFLAMALVIYTIVNSTRAKRYAFGFSFLAFSPLLFALAMTML